ncbi:hypothetical protein ACFOEY_18385 [Paracandidimonas soli]|uniref:hypothetical protein n=1 Tax=Paracandidimonas soli TaxID=1917182 RepID=UPI00360F6A15
MSCADRRADYRPTRQAFVEAVNGFVASVCTEDDAFPLSRVSGPEKASACAAPDEFRRSAGREIGVKSRARPGRIKPRRASPVAVAAPGARAAIP